MGKINKILVVVDMQNDFVTGSLGSVDAKAIVSKAVGKYMQYKEDPNAYIIFTKDTHEIDYLSSSEGKKLPVRHCIRSTEGWELIPAFGDINDTKDKTLVITKSTFGSNVLATYIRGIIGDSYSGSYESWDEFKEKILPKVDIEIIGLCTDICVVSNALILKAEFPDNNITVDSNCCAGTTPEAHDAAIKVMKSCQIDII